MAREPTSIRLSKEQRREVCLILSVGCDRETAARFARCSPADIRREMAGDRRFAGEVRHAEASSEMTHMRNVQSAARENKNWRASVWWLERRAPERYGRRDAGVVTTRQLDSFIAQLVSAVMEEVHDGEDRQRLFARLKQIGQSLQAMSQGEDGTQAGVVGNSELPQPEESDADESEDAADFSDAIEPDCDDRAP